MPSFASDEEDGSFEDALHNAKLTPAVFPSQLCEDLDLESMLDTDRETERRIRAIMETGHGPDRFLFAIDTMAHEKRAEARAALLGGQVAAVDGTDALR